MGEGGRGASSGLVAPSVEVVLECACVVEVLSSLPVQCVCLGELTVIWL